MPQKESGFPFLSNSVKERWLYVLFTQHTHTTYICVLSINFIWFFHFISSHSHLLLLSFGWKENLIHLSIDAWKKTLFCVWEISVRCGFSSSSYSCFLKSLSLFHFIPFCSRNLLRRAQTMHARLLVLRFVSIQWRNTEYKAQLN